jgi:hypothetical protein
MTPTKQKKKTKPSGDLMDFLAFICLVGGIVSVLSGVEWALIAIEGAEIRSVVKHLCIYGAGVSAAAVVWALYLGIKTPSAGEEEETDDDTTAIAAVVKLEPETRCAEQSATAKTENGN